LVALAAVASDLSFESSPELARAREYARGRLLEVATTDLDKQETWRRAIAVAHLVCKA
jgi:hypothetical protein